MFENVDGRTDDGVTGILIAHLGAFSSGELKMGNNIRFWLYDSHVKKPLINIHAGQ